MSRMQPAPLTDQGNQGANSNENRLAPILPQELSQRYMRLLAALLNGPTMRESVDRIAGTSNGPHYIAGLRALGLRIACERINAVDRDGKPCRPGRYHLCPKSRRLARSILRGGD